MPQFNFLEFLGLQQKQSKFGEVMQQEPEGKPPFNLLEFLIPFQKRLVQEQLPQYFYEQSLTDIPQQPFLERLKTQLPELAKTMTPAGIEAGVMYGLPLTIGLGKGIPAAGTRGALAGGGLGAAEEYSKLLGGELERKYEGVKDEKELKEILGKDLFERIKKIGGRALTTAIFSMILATAGRGIGKLKGKIVEKIKSKEAIDLSNQAMKYRSPQEQQALNFVRSAKTSAEKQKRLLQIVKKNPGIAQKVNQRLQGKGLLIDYENVHNAGIDLDLEKKLGSLIKKVFGQYKLAPPLPTKLPSAVPLTPTTPQVPIEAPGMTTPTIEPPGGMAAYKVAVDNLRRKGEYVIPGSPLDTLLREKFNLPKFGRFY